jgi:SAM-dependent methyltransferase
MIKFGTAWATLRCSVAQQGLGRTVRSMLQRTPREDDATSENPPELHPFDLRYGVNTSGLIGGGDLRSGHKHDVFNTAYYGMSPSRFQQVMADWLSDGSHAAVADYSFVDLGCGKGRAVMMGSAFPFRQVIGVELNDPLAKIAQKNIAAWKAAGRAICPVQILCHDATEFVFPDGPCLLYLFNPFAAPVVERLVERIEAEFAARPGMMDLIYFNPEAGHLLDAHEGFELLWTGTVQMSEEDVQADHVASPDDLCSIYRWVGRKR